MRPDPQEMRDELYLSNKFKRYLAVLGPTQNCFRCVSFFSPVPVKLTRFALTGQMFYLFGHTEVPGRFKLYFTYKRFVIWHLILP